MDIPGKPQRAAAPTGVLRFFQRKDGSKILQQEFAVITMPAKTRSFEWHDVPLVMDEPNPANVV